MGISLGFDLTPDLFDIVASLLPSLVHVSSIGIKTAVVPVMIVDFRIAVVGKPGLHRSPFHSHLTGTTL
jgi:hypothetical protein